MALETVHSEARSVRKIIFVLWEDRLYDTWISMAHELQFIPLEDDRTAIMNNSTHPTGTDDDHDRTHRNAYSTMRVDDATSKQCVGQCGRMDHVRQMHAIAMLMLFMITGARLPFCRNRASLERRI